MSRFLLRFSSNFSRLTAAALATLFFAYVPSAHAAIVELRGGYIMDNVSASDINGKFTYPKLDSMTGYNADVLISPPFFPFNFGARYENLTKKASNTTGGYDAKFKRVSLLLDKRFIDTIAYLGVIGTVGVVNDFNYDITGTGAQSLKSTGLSGTLGVEAGVKLGFFLLGAEVGYEYAKLSDLKKSDGSTYMTTGGSSVKVDLSGVYLRGSVGFGF